MRIQEFAQALGVSADTVRRLERRGVLTPVRDWAGHRRFTEADVDRARAVLFKQRGAQHPDKRTRHGARVRGGSMVRADNIAAAPDSVPR